MHCGNKIDDRGMNGYCSLCLSWCADSFLPGQIEKSIVAAVELVADKVAELGKVRSSFIR